MHKELFKFLALGEYDVDLNSHQYKNDVYGAFAHRNPALCIIDMQRYYCDKNINGNDETEQILKPILEIKERFNDLDIPVYVIYMDGQRRGIDRANGGLYGIEPNDSDITIAKDADSVFKASRWCGGEKIQDSLAKREIDTLFITGVHFSVCVQETALDAAKDYDTFVIGDCTANGQTRGMVSPYHSIKIMRDRGVKFISSQFLLKGLNDAYPEIQPAEPAAEEADTELLLTPQI